MSTIDADPALARRAFLRRATALSLGIGGLAASMRFARAGDARGKRTPSPGATAGHGPLVRDPERLLDLPAGFTYRVVSRTGERMSDGLLLPAAPDGMAAFPGPGARTIVVRNHELGTAPALAGAFGPLNELFTKVPRGRVFDAGSGGQPCLGGTTTFVYDTRAGRLESQFLSLAGTIRNCSGGPTPWGTWVSCEETTDRRGNGLLEDHGFNFEVKPGVEPALVAPVPLRAMGRFKHEAVAVDPRSSAVYQTEDQPDGLVYRFLPSRPGRLADGGRLQALALRDRPSADMRNWDERRILPGEPYAVRWIDLDDVASPFDDLRGRGFAKGAAIFARGEGMARGSAEIFFACTSGGKARRGQLWRYVPSPREGTADETASPARLELFLEPDDAAAMDMPDNLTVAPWGDLVVCEDGNDEQFLLGISPAGKIYQLARNARDESELAGATFSPDATTLFVNLQKTGLTLAITGPWRSAAS